MATPYANSAHPAGQSRDEMDTTSLLDGAESSRSRLASPSKVRPFADRRSNTGGRLTEASGNMLDLPRISTIARRQSGAFADGGVADGSGEPRATDLEQTEERSLRHRRGRHWRTRWLVMERAEELLMAQNCCAMTAVTWRCRDWPAQVQLKPDTTEVIFIADGLGRTLVRNEMGRRGLREAQIVRRHRSGTLTISPSTTHQSNLAVAVQLVTNILLRHHWRS